MKRELRYPRVVIFRETLLAVSPKRLVAFYRRRRALRRYLRDISFEIEQRQMRTERLELDELEGRIVDRDGFYARLIKEVLRGTEETLEQLDRQIEGVTARHSNEIRALRADLASLRNAIETRVSTRDAASGAPREAKGDPRAMPSAEPRSASGGAADARG